MWVSFLQKLKQGSLNDQILPTKLNIFELYSSLFLETKTQVSLMIKYS